MPGHLTLLNGRPAQRRQPRLRPWPPPLTFRLGGRRGLAAEAARGKGPACPDILASLSGLRLVTPICCNVIFAFPASPGSDAA
jgi:hypothetical protein